MKLTSLKDMEIFSWENDTWVERCNMTRRWRVKEDREVLQGREQSEYKRLKGHQRGWSAENEQECEIRCEWRGMQGPNYLE